jgi:formylglycine-generating enzyme required for sulfatase activity
MQSSMRTISASESQLIRIGGGVIALKDESKNRFTTVQVRPFRIAKIPVTRELYESLLASSCVPGAMNDEPAVDVSWLDAIRYCNSLSRRCGLREYYATNDDGDVERDSQSDGYRLPTEAEWEYACRAGSNDVRYGELDAIAWYQENSAGGVHTVGMKEPNAWGLYDMIGNVWEWCWDLYDADVYGPYRVFRGGGWSDPATACRASCRRKSHPTFKIDDLGFRLARSIMD